MENIKAIVEEQLNTTVTNVSAVGNGGTASCYCVEITSSPFRLVVKTSKYFELMCEEMKMNEFLRNNVSFKIPETYFITEKNSVSYLGIEFIYGASGKELKLKDILLMKIE